MNYLSKSDLDSIMGEMCRWMSGRYYSLPRKDTLLLRRITEYVTPPTPPMELFRFCPVTEKELWEFHRTRVLKTCPGDRGISSWTTSPDKAKAFAERSSSVPDRESGFGVLVGSSFSIEEALAYIPHLAENFPQYLDEYWADELSKRVKHWSDEDEWVMVDEGPRPIHYLEIAQPGWGWDWHKVDFDKFHNQWYRRLLSKSPWGRRPIPLIKASS